MSQFTPDENHPHLFIRELDVSLASLERVLNREEIYLRLAKRQDFDTIKTKLGLKPIPQNRLGKFLGKYATNFRTSINFYDSLSEDTRFPDEQRAHFKQDLEERKQRLYSLESKIAEIIASLS